MIGVGIAAAVVAIEHAEQQTAFDDYIGKKGETTAWSDIDPHPAEDDMAGKLDQIALMLAITGSLTGSPQSMEYYVPPGP